MKLKFNIKGEKNEKKTHENTKPQNHKEMQLSEINQMIYLIYELEIK